MAIFWTTYNAKQKYKNNSERFYKINNYNHKNFYYLIVFYLIVKFL